MNDKCFLDTNIFVYSFDETEPVKLRKARSLIEESVLAGSGVISFQVVQEFFSVALRGFAARMTLAHAERYFLNVLQPFFSVHSSPTLYLEALRLHADHHLSWYDALIVAAALQARCKVLYTEDLQHGRKFGTLRVQNPFL